MKNYFKKLFKSSLALFFFSLSSLQGQIIDPYGANVFLEKNQTKAVKAEFINRNIELVAAGMSLAKTVRLLDKNPTATEFIKLKIDESIINATIARASEDLANFYGQLFELTSYEIVNLSAGYRSLALEITNAYNFSKNNSNILINKAYSEYLSNYKRDFSDPFSLLFSNVYKKQGLQLSLQKLRSRFINLGKSYFFLIYNSRDIPEFQANDEFKTFKNTTQLATYLFDHLSSELIKNYQEISN